MDQPRARAAPHPVLSSPAWLTVAGLFVIALVFMIQTTSGVPAWAAFAPVELSSNVVAVMGLAWALLQLRARWSEPRFRKAWAAISAAMLLLAVEGGVGEMLLMQPHDTDEMGVSIGLWLLAASLLFSGGRAFAPRRSVGPALRAGFAVQLAAQAAGWLAAVSVEGAHHIEPLEYLTDMGELAAVLTYVCALLLAEFAPLKAYRFPAAAIGAKARAALRDFGPPAGEDVPLRDRLRRSGPARWIAAGTKLVWRAASAGPAVRRAGGPSTARQLAQLVGLGLRGVDPRTYYLLELFRPSHREALDEFVTRTESGSGPARRLGALARDPSRLPELADRVAFTRICEANGLPAALILAVAGHGSVSACADHAAFDRDLFVKPRIAGRGGAAAFRRVEPFVYRDAEGRLHGFDALMTRFAMGAPAGGAIVQSKLGNDERLRFLADESLVVFRAVTCIDRRGEPQLTHGLVRLMRRFEPRWPASPEAEWGAAVDLATSALGPLAGNAPETCASWRPDHPVSGVAVEGVRVSGWKEIAETALAAHRVFAGRPVVGWDLALTPDGVRLLGGDTDIDVAFLQRCCRTPLGRSPLAPLLDVHLDVLIAEEQRAFMGEPRPAGPAASRRPA